MRLCAVVNNNASGLFLLKKSIFMWSLCVFLRNNFLNFTSIFISTCMSSRLKYSFLSEGIPVKVLTLLFGRQSLDVFNLRQWASNMEEN